jgi:hypothetical protein
MRRTPNHRAEGGSKTDVPTAPPPQADADRESVAIGPFPGLDQSWRFRKWLLEAAFLAARGERPDLSEEHFVSLANEAISLLPDPLFGAALQAAYEAWLAARVAAGAEVPDDPFGALKGWRDFYREVLATEGLLLVPHAGSVTSVILGHIEARRPPPPSPRPVGRQGRRPLDEAEVRDQVRAAREWYETRDRRAGIPPGSSRPKRDEIADHMGISPTTLYRYLARFPGLRHELP